MGLAFRLKHIIILTSSKILTDILTDIKARPINQELKFYQRLKDKQASKKPESDVV